MKQQRPKQPEWGKPLKFIDRRDDFLRVDAVDGEPVVLPERKKEAK
jgi:hypothetical protein